MEHSVNTILLLGLINLGVYDLFQVESIGFTSYHLLVALLAAQFHFIEKLWLQQPLYVVFVTYLPFMICTASYLLLKVFNGIGEELLRGKITEHCGIVGGRGC